MLLLTPDEAVLVLLTLLPLAFLVAEMAPRCRRRLVEFDLEAQPEGGWQRYYLEGEEEGAPSTSMMGRLAVCYRATRLWLARLMGHDELLHQNAELNAALSAVIAERRWHAAKLQAQIALRQRDREQNQKALYTAVHTLRTVATAERGAHQEQVAALEQTVIAASHELQRERDERLESERSRHALSMHKFEAAERAQRAAIVSELARLEAESQTRVSELSIEVGALRAQLGESPTAQPQEHSASAGVRAISDARHARLERELQEARDRLAESEAREASLMASLETLQGGLSSYEQGAAVVPPLVSDQATAADGADHPKWRDLHAVLGSPAPLAINPSAAELKLIRGQSVGGAMHLKRGDASCLPLGTKQVWSAAQLWKTVDAANGFMVGGTEKEQEAAAVLGTALTQLERSIEEEVCAWDYREFNYCWHGVASEAPVEGDGGTPLKIASGARAGQTLVRDQGHGGMSLADFCEAPEARRARLTGAEVIALRLATGRLGGVLNAALQAGTKADLAPWATTLACTISAVVKLSTTADPLARIAIGDVYLAVNESHGSLLLGDSGLLSGLFRKVDGSNAKRVVSRGFLGVTSDPWCARETLGSTGRKRAIALLSSASSSAANVSWVSQFPQQCELLLPPQTTLVQGGAEDDTITIEGVRCLELRVEQYEQPQPYTAPFHRKPPTAELSTALSVPGCAAAIHFVCTSFGSSAAELGTLKKLPWPAGKLLSPQGAKMLGLLCGRAAKEACPALEELSLHGAHLSMEAFDQFVLGLSGVDEHDSGAIRLDLHGSLASVLEAEPQLAPAVGEMLANLFESAPFVVDLDLGSTPLGHLGITPIARALAKNGSVAQLNLASTSLGPSLDAAKRLAAAIRQNGDLVVLDLRHNSMTPEAIKLIQAAAAARPLSAAGDHEHLELLFEPQALATTTTTHVTAPSEQQASTSRQERERFTFAAPWRKSKVAT